VALPVVASPPQQHRRVPINLPPEHPPYKRPLVSRNFIIFSCIVLWLTAIAFAIAVLVVFIAYHPKKPVLSLSTASLNAGYVNELNVSGGPSSGLSLNADLTVLAIISNNNTKLDVELHYMQLDLYFNGHMIGTQVLPAPARERPGEYALRYVHFVTSGVPLPPEDAEAWRNATANGGPVVLDLAGHFRTRMIGPGLRFPLQNYPHCTLWLRPPPGGKLLESRCRQ
jgi:hypothetical protein